MPGVVNFHSDGQETLATTLTPPGEDRAAIFRFHAGTEAELAFPGALGRLVGAFHVKRKEPSEGKGAQL